MSNHSQQIELSQIQSKRLSAEQMLVWLCTNPPFDKYMQIELNRLCVIHSIKKAQTQYRTKIRELGTHIKKMRYLKPILMTGFIANRSFVDGNPNGFELLRLYSLIIGYNNFTYDAITSLLNTYSQGQIATWAAAISHLNDSLREYSEYARGNTTSFNIAAPKSHNNQRAYNNNNYSNNYNNNSSNYKKPNNNFKKGSKRNYYTKKWLKNYLFLIFFANFIN